MSRPRLLHLTHRDSLGGGPVVISSLLKGLQNDTEQLLVYGGTPGRAAATSRALGIPSVRVALDSLPRAATVGLLQLIVQFRRFSPSVTFLHGQWAGPIGTLAWRASGRPGRLVYLAHCSAFYHSTTLTRAIRNYLAEIIPCHSAHTVVALSHGSHYQYLFRGWVPESRLTLIHNGIDPQQTPAPEKIAHHRDDVGMSPDEVHVVFCGRLDPQKRPDWMLHAWAGHRQQCSSSVKSRLWMIGDGPWAHRVRLLRHELRLTDSVELVGPSDHGPLWIAAADLVILTSVFEGHALVPLEAMAASRPVLAMHCEGIDDSIVHQQTGLLVELGDIPSMASAITQLVSDSALRQKLGHQALTHVTKNFPLERTITAYRRLIFEQSPNDERCH